jgi:hypothetical protein
MSSFDSLFQYYFGQLSNDYCNLFLIFSGFSFVALIITLFTTVSIIFYKLTGKSKLSAEGIIASLSVIIIHFVNYMVARLLYNMCKSSSK